MAGAFAQVDYHFAPGGATAASAPLLSYAPIFKAPAFKAPAAAPAYDWTGFYTGIEGGWAWGETKQVGQPTNRITFDSTPSFHTSGGLIGATVGYNSQFNRMWVFGFEGDALLAAWRRDIDPLPSLLLRCCSCALAIQRQFKDWKVDDQKLLMRISIGAGEILGHADVSEIALRQRAAQRTR